MNETHDPSGFDGTPSDESKSEDPAGLGSTADESFGWTTDQEPAAGGGDARATAERMIGQLQDMIDSLATQAAPMARQIGAKAAELAAVAADRAGPLAHRAAEATADASGRLAERSRTWAAELRSHAATDAQAEAAGGTTATLDPADTSVADVESSEPAGDTRN
jgi:hypothetical protein